MKQQENNFKFHSLINLGIISTIIGDLDKAYWIKEIYNYKKQNPNSINQSNKGGWQSDRHLNQHSIFFPLCKKLQDLFYQFNPNPQGFINMMWGNISLYSNFNAPHIHGSDTYPYTKYSGVIYLKIPPNSGNIVFMNPLNPGLGLKFAPCENEVIFFPSPIQHYVEPNLSQEERISIAFNFN
jgi:hypothetical protein